MGIEAGSKTTAEVDRCLTRYGRMRRNATCRPSYRAACHGSNEQCHCKLPCSPIEKIARPARTPARASARATMIATTCGEGEERDRTRGNILAESLLAT